MTVTTLSLLRESSMAVVRPDTPALKLLVTQDFVEAPGVNAFTLLLQLY